MSTPSPWEYFSVEELTCHCGCGQGPEKMDPIFMADLVALRNQLGFALPLSSAYRCPTHNAQVSRTGLVGPHTTGHAVDIVVYGVRADVLVRTVIKFFRFTGIGLKQHGAHGNRFIHLDDLPTSNTRTRSIIWTYS